MSQIKKDVRIKIHSEIYDLDISLSESDNIDVNSIPVREDSPEPQILDINIFGSYVDDGERISISYDESEATGMEGSLTTVTFLKNEPSIISMIREGMVSTTLVFENEKRHHCLYKTPFMPFEICVKTIQVSNALLGVGSLSLDYIVEIGGSQTERTKFTMQILN